MKTIKQFNISLIIRGVIIPIILLATLLGGYRLNQKIVSLIDFGFTEKLATLSSTAGAFVRLEDHNILIQPRRFYNIRTGPSGDHFVLSSEGRIHRLFTDGSVTLEPVIPFLAEYAHLASFAYLGDSLVTVNESGLLAIWSPTGEILTETVVNTRPNSTVATSASGNQIAFGPDESGIIQILSKDLELITSITQPTSEVLDLGFNPDGHLVVLTDNQELISIDSSTGDVSDTVPITCPNSDACAIIHSITCTDQEQIWGLSDALTLLSKDGTIDADFYAHPNYHDHTSDRYLNYVIPMREIREKQELTYLYSFILNNDDKTIAYVLDSSIDDDFTHIGYIDSELELDDFIAGTDVLLTTKAYVSEIKPWGQWGLVKIGFAPIYRPEGRGAAIMGADQNVSSIDQVSREALVILSLSSFVFLLFGATASWFIARSLTSPLLALKDNVLSIAAGFLDRNVAEPSLKDLRPLAAVFREAGDNLKKEVVQGPQILQKFETLRLEQDYRSYLDLKLRDELTLPVSFKINTAYRQSVAWISTESATVIWVLKDGGSPLDVELKWQNTVFQTANALLQGDKQLETVLMNLDNTFKSRIGLIIGIIHGSNDILVIRSESYIISETTTSVKPGVITRLKSIDLKITSSEAKEILSISKRSAT